MGTITTAVIAHLAILGCPACGLPLEYAAWPPVTDEPVAPLEATWDCVRRHAAFLPHEEWQSLRLQQLADASG